MYRVDSILGHFPHYLLSSEAGAHSPASACAISPERGAIAFDWRVAGEPIFYLDDATLLDPTKNVRGGNPILFPAPGKLTGDVWARGERSATMKQHGFARTLPWAVVSTSTEEGARLALSLESTEATRAAYPWDFRFELAYTLRGNTLRIDQRVTNRDSTAMPFGVGFHPYFAVGDKARAQIDTRATRVFDNVTKQSSPFRGFNLAHGETDLHLLDHGSPESALHLGPADANRSIAVRGSAEFTYWVVWTVDDKPFVCVEPWTCPGNALNTGERLIELAPGETRALWVEMTAG